MKVLHIVKVSEGATWVLHQVRVLRQLGIDVVVAQPSATEGNARRYRELGAEVVAADVDFPGRWPWRLPAVLRRCRELVAQVQPDIIHTHHVGTTYVARLALGKRHPIPRVFRVAGVLHLEYWPFARADVALAGPRDYWISISSLICKKYEALGVPREKVFLIYNGIDTSAFCAVRTGKLRRELGITNGTPLVGMVAVMYAPKRYLGHLHGVKGHEFFIEALRLVLEQRPDVRGILIGGAWNNAVQYEKQLHRMARAICGDRLIFAGMRDDLTETYADLDLSVLPSLSEGFPKAAAEALLSGVPIVATRVGGLPDIVHDGETGWLVPPRNPKALAAAILEALAHPEEARRRTERGAELVRELLDAEHTGRQIAALYERILGCHDGKR